MIIMYLASVGLGWCLWNRFRVFNVSGDGISVNYVLVMVD